MTCSPERGGMPAASGSGSVEGGQGGADLNAGAGVRLGRTVVGERALDFGTRVAHAPEVDEALRPVEYIECVNTSSASGDSRSAAPRRESSRGAFNRRLNHHARLGEPRQRRPRLGVEHVLQRPLLFDVHGEVRRALPERETRGGLQKRRAYSFDGVERGLLCPGRCDPTGDEQEREPCGTRAHAVRTPRRRFRPVEHVGAEDYNRWGGQ